MKRVVMVLAATFALTSPALANQNWQDKDANGDGQISKAEHDAGVTAAWTAQDRDRNGQLSMAEAGMKAGSDWTAADTNGDGQLSQSEFMAKKTAWFGKADSNGDGLLVDAVALRQNTQALLTMLYRSTDRLCRTGAPVQDSSHSASFHD